MARLTAHARGVPARAFPRRRLFAAGGGALASLAMPACGGTKRAAPSLPPSPTSEIAAAPTPTTSATATATAHALPRGGVARLVAPASLDFDTFDALRSGETAVLEVLGRTHSRLLQWDTERSAILGDLAAAWEQPDERTLVVRLHPAATWHDLPPLNGRAVAAGDVVQHLNRAQALARAGRLPTVQRAQDILSVSTAAAVDARAVRIETARPDPFLLATLAARFALVQAPEAVAAFEADWPKLRASSVVGSGPFVYRGRSDGVLSFSAHPTGHRPPALDGLAVHPPGGDDDARLLAQRVDEAILRDRRDAPRLREARPGAFRELSRLEEAPVTTTMFVGAPPWNHPGLRLALSGALHRVELGRRLFAGRAVPAYTPAAWPAFGIADPAALAGYGDFAAGAREARSRWEAAGGPGLGPVTVDFPSIFDPVYSASSVVIGLLNEVLGNQFRPAVETYTVVSARALGRRYGNGSASFWFGWGPPFAEPDPSRSLIETFASTSPGFATTGFKDPAIDEALAALGTTFALPDRQARVREILGMLLRLGGGGAIDWVIQRQEVFRWPYLDAPPPSPWPSHWRDAEASLDPSAVGFASRPA